MEGEQGEGKKIKLTKEWESKGEINESMAEELRPRYA